MLSFWGNRTKGKSKVGVNDVTLQVYPSAAIGGQNIDDGTTSNSRSTKTDTSTDISELRLTNEHEIHGAVRAESTHCINQSTASSDLPLRTGHEPRIITQSARSMNTKSGDHIEMSPLPGERKQRQNRHNNGTDRGSQSRLHQRHQVHQI